jgi:hypothetical protein
MSSYPERILSSQKDTRPPPKKDFSFGTPENQESFATGKTLDSENTPNTHSADQKKKYSGEFIHIEPEYSTKKTLNEQEVVQAINIEKEKKEIQMEEQYDEIMKLIHPENELPFIKKMYESSLFNAAIGKKESISFLIKYAKTKAKEVGLNPEIVSLAVHREIENYQTKILATPITDTYIDAIREQSQKQNTIAMELMRRYREENKKNEIQKVREAIQTSDIFQPGKIIDSNEHVTPEIQTFKEQIRRGEIIRMAYGDKKLINEIIGGLQSTNHQEEINKITNEITEIRNDIKQKILNDTLDIDTFNRLSAYAITGIESPFARQMIILHANMDGRESDLTLKALEGRLSTEERRILYSYAKLGIPYGATLLQQKAIKPHSIIKGFFRSLFDRKKENKQKKSEEAPPIPINRERNLKENPILPKKPALHKQRNKEKEKKELREQIKRGEIIRIAYGEEKLREEIIGGLESQGNHKEAKYISEEVQKIQLKIIEEIQNNTLSINNFDRLASYAKVGIGNTNETTTLLNPFAKKMILLHAHVKGRESELTLKTQNGTLSTEDRKFLYTYAKLGISYGEKLLHQKPLPTYSISKGWTKIKHFFGKKLPK